MGSNAKTKGLIEADSPYSWLVFAVAFLAQAVAMGTTYSVGVFSVEWMDHFSVSPESVSWVGALNIAAVFGLAPFPSYLANRFGHRSIVIVSGLVAATGYVTSAFANDLNVLYFTYGILSGLGTCAAYTINAVVTGFYFKKWQSLALVLSATGGGIGCIIFPPLYRLLIKQYSWRGAMILTGGIALNYSWFGAALIPVMKKKPSLDVHDLEKSELNVLSDHKDKKQKALWHDYRLYIMMLSHSLWTMGSSIFFMFFVDFAQLRHIERDTAAFMMSISALGGTLIRIVVSGVFAQCKTFPAIQLYIAFCFLCGAPVILLPFTHAYAAMFAVCCMVYTFYGGIISTLGLTTVQMFGLRNATSAFGLLMFGCGMGGVIGPPVGGWLYGKASGGGYLLSFTFGGVVLIISGIIVTFAFCIEAAKKNNNDIKST